MRKDVRPGAQFPDYELSDHTVTRRKLSELQGTSPMVLHLSRGGYDPKEHWQMRRLAEAYPEFKVGYTQVVTISTDDQLATNELRDAVGAEWPFLSDPDRIVQKDLDIQEYTDPVHDPMIPHTFVLRPELKIFRMYNGYWYWGRPSVEELRRDLRMWAGRKAGTLRGPGPYLFKDSPTLKRYAGGAYRMSTNGSIRTKKGRRAHPRSRQSRDPGGSQTLPPWPVKLLWWARVAAVPALRASPTTC